MDNPFEPDKKIKDESKELEKKISSLVKQASKLLDNPEYKKYKDMYISFRDRVYKLLQESPETDAQKFTIEAKVWLAKLDVLNLLIDELEKDVLITKRRGKK